MQNFARKLGCDWIGLVPVASEAFAEPWQCHSNVKIKVKFDGGTHVTGHYFVELFDGTIVQSVAHSVWKTSTGSLVDITPFPDGRKYVCFASSRNTSLIPNTFAQFPDKYIHAQHQRSDDDRQKEDSVMFYVYVLIDPRTRNPFYIGKGTGQRAQQHLWQISREHNPYKINTIRAIRAAGLEPEIVYAAENISDEQLAYDLEAKLIKLWGRKGYDANGILTNVVADGRPPNHKGRTYGWTIKVECDEK